MKDLAIVVGSPRQIMVSGKTYSVPKFTPSIIGRMNAWLKDQVPDPRDVAKRRMEGLPDAVALAIWSDAVKEAKTWPPTFGSPEGDEYLMAYNGWNVLVYELLKLTTPGITPDDVNKIVDSIGADGVNEILKLAAMEIREPIDPGGDDPKAS